jgi:hypothetical protein
VLRTRRKTQKFRRAICKGYRCLRFGSKREKIEEEGNKGHRFGAVRAVEGVGEVEIVGRLGRKKRPGVEDKPNGWGLPVGEKRKKK